MDRPENKPKVADQWVQGTSAADTPNRSYSEPEPLYLGIASGDYFGWGVCSQYLIKELSKKTRVFVLSDEDGSATNPRLNGKLLQALPVPTLEGLFQEARGVKNYGYTFFENELSRVSYENAQKYDLILAGSSWCRDRLRELGIQHCDVLLQGIDPEIFYPSPARGDQNNFIVFSGGKFELRKGQDLVLKAVKIIQEKYHNVILVNCWYNFWPKIMQDMDMSPYLKYEYRGNSWLEVMNHIYEINGLDSQRIVTLEPISHHTLREVYESTDIGIFPNRCEGGTNLVMMEYMACGRPVIASNTSGHRDILTPKNALLLNEARDIHITDRDRNLIARWQDFSLDELVARLEYAYHHRREIQQIGVQAAEDLKEFTWTETARRLLNIVAAGRQ